MPIRSIRNSPFACRMGSIFPFSISLVLLVLSVATVVRIGAMCHFSPLTYLTSHDVWAMYSSYLVFAVMTLQMLVCAWFFIRMTENLQGHKRQGLGVVAIPIVLFLVFSQASWTYMKAEIAGFSTQMAIRIAPSVIMSRAAAEEKRTGKPVDAMETTRQTIRKLYIEGGYEVPTYLTDADSFRRMVNLKQGCSIGLERQCQDEAALSRQYAPDQFIGLPAFIETVFSHNITGLKGEMFVNAD